MPDNQFYSPGDDPHAEVDDRGGVYNRDSQEHDPRSEDNRPVLRGPRQGEVHARAISQEVSMEGVVTGDPHDHYVHLANGAVVTGCSGGTHYDDPEWGLVPIVARFPAGKDLS